MVKKQFRVVACVLAASLLLALTACTKPDKPTEPSETKTDVAPDVLYEVSIIDGAGSSLTHGITVHFLKDGKQVATQPVDEKGIAAIKLPAGEYTVELMSADSETSLFFDLSKAVLTADQPRLTLEVTVEYDSEDRQIIYVHDEPYTAPIVNAGCSQIVLREGMNYVLFMPLEAGEYLFSLPGSQAKIGYYGSPHFVRAGSILEVIDNTVTISVRESMISQDDPSSSVFVIGIESDSSAENCTLCIERIGEPAWDVSEEPWITYEATALLKPYQLPAGANLTDFDVTASSDTYNLVYNESDGYYHLNTADGPLVLMYLTEPSRYLDDIVTVANVSNICSYFYDGNGKFVKRETYSECILKYRDYADSESGVYPLTQDLIYIIQQHGTYYGWWDAENLNNCIFKDDNGNIKAGINPEIAWLFCCCYISE